RHGSLHILVLAGLRTLVAGLRRLIALAPNTIDQGNNPGFVSLAKFTTLNSDQGAQFALVHAAPSGQCGDVDHDEPFLPLLVHPQSTAMPGARRPGVVARRNLMQWPSRPQGVRPKPS